MLRASASSRCLASSSAWDSASETMLWISSSESPEPELLVVGVPSSRSSLTPSRADLAPLEVRNRLERFSTFHGELDVDFSTVSVQDVGNWPVSEMDPVPLIGEVMRLAGDLPAVDRLDDGFRERVERHVPAEEPIEDRAEQDRIVHSATMFYRLYADIFRTLTPAVAMAA